jgi:hypothetical protein
MKDPFELKQRCSHTFGICSHSFTSGNEIQEEEIYFTTFLQLSQVQFRALPMQRVPEASGL